METESPYQEFRDAVKSLRESVDLHLDKISAAKKKALESGEMETAARIRDFEKKLIESRIALFPGF